jgi:hypothetical protein
MPNLSTGSARPENLGTVIPDNHGRHVIHTGGTYDSYLQLPVKQSDQMLIGYSIDPEPDSTC